MLDQVREQIRLKHYSIRTEQVYCKWVKRFIRFHRYQHPRSIRDRPRLITLYLLGHNHGLSPNIPYQGQHRVI
jgi:hypothetical protein